MDDAGVLEQLEAMVILDRAAELQGLHGDTDPIAFAATVVFTRVNEDVMGVAVHAADGDGDMTPDEYTAHMLGHAIEALTE